MSEKIPPIVPTVFVIGAQSKPYDAAPITRYQTLYHTQLTVRGQAGGKAETIQQTNAYCLPDDAAWSTAQAAYTALKEALAALGADLRELGSYRARLKAAGGIKAAPNPLSPTAISISDPDNTQGWWFSPLEVPQIERIALDYHTPEMLRETGKDYTGRNQKDHTICPADSDWERIAQLHQTARQAQDAWEALLQELGTYKAALEDGRYRQPMTIPRLNMHIPSVEPSAPGPRASDFAQGSLVIWTRADGAEILGRVTTCFSGKRLAIRVPPESAVPRYVDPARCRVAPAQPQEQPAPKEEQSMAGPTDAFHNLPPKLAGWRWQQNGTTAEWHLVAPDGSWRTKDYTYSNRAISEALRRVNSEPKPEPAQEAATPATPVASQIVPLSTMAIRTDGGTQSRAELHQETVNEYAEAMQAGAHFPPVITYYDGEVYWLADGFHRVAAARQLKSDIQAEVRQGTRRDAVLEACGANANHGLRRTNADKRRAVETLLRDEEWRQWSDREIARRAGVHHELVGRLRGELGLTGGIRQSSNGRLMDTSGIGQANAARAEQAAPPVPLTPEARDDEPKTDADHITAIRRYLEQQRQVGRLTNPATYNTACDMASAIHDGETYRAMIKEIGDAALPPPPEPRSQRLGPGQSEPPAWPDPPPGWRWNRRGAPAHLIGPDGWTTQNYNVPERALAEAQQRMLSQSTADPYEPGDAEFRTMQARWLTIGYGQFYRSDHGYTSYKASEGSWHYRDWPTVEATITRKEAEHAGQAAADLAADRQRLQVARTHIEMADQSTLPAQTRQHILDARRLLYFVSDGLASERQALETETVRILAGLDGRTVPPSRAAAPVRPARPKSGDVSVVLAYVTALEAYATELERLLELPESEPIRATQDDRATFEALLDDLEQMAGAGDLSPEQIASGTRALEQLDDRYNELLSDLSHEEAQRYSDRMDALQVVFEQAESQQETMA